MDQKSEKKSKCVCSIAGYCKSHEMEMTARQHAQCRDEPGFFEVFQRFAAKARGRRPKPFIGPPRPPKAGQVGGPEGPPTPPTPCGGCQGRKEWMNSVIPKSGDAVEWVTTKTGIKEKWERHLEKKERRAVLDQHFAGWQEQDPAIVTKWMEAWELT